VSVLSIAPKIRLDIEKREDKKSKHKWKRKG
jgi:hypothetical protein